MIQERLLVYEDALTGLYKEGRKYMRKEILNEIEYRLTKKYGKNGYILKEVIKNNGVKLAGIALRGSESAIQPVVYIDDLIEKGVAEKMPILALWEAVVARLEESENVEDITENTGVNDIINRIGDWNYIRKFIRGKLVNLARNESYFIDSGIPFSVVLNDLAFVPYILLDGTDTVRRATITVNAKIIEMWGIDRLKFMEILYGAYRIESPIIKKMSDLLANMYPYICDDGPVMYVLTNKEGYFGASSILGTTLEELKKMTGFHNIIAIPSSIHEWILADLGDYFNGDIDGLVNSVNSDVLEETEILSDHAYVLSNYIW